ncbi:MAG: 4-hydroxy-2-oxovalerate aldolase [Brevinema sp.]
MDNILFFDSTLRDGSHAIAHRLSKDVVSLYCQAIDNTGMHTVIVGHGMGLGGSSVHTGLSLLSDEEMLITAKEKLHNTKLGAFVIPGLGTIKNNIMPALDLGVNLFCVASHCTESNVTRQHIEYLAKQNGEVYGVLMMYHMIPTDILVMEALKMQSYGASGIIIMDSAGASTPELVRKTISTLVSALRIRVGFHAHNNMGLAVSNTYIAIKEGATIVDATTRGFGAGAGNCLLEALTALLMKEEIPTPLDFKALCKVSTDIIAPIAPVTQGIDPISIVSGMSGVFSGFTPHIKKAGLLFNVNPLDIFIELGKLKVVAGQEDVIFIVAKKLSEQKNNAQGRFHECF